MMLKKKTHTHTQIIRLCLCTHSKTNIFNKSTENAHKNAVAIYVIENWRKKNERFLLVIVIVVVGIR